MRVSRGMMVASTTKSRLLDDLAYIERRTSEVLKGNVKFMDANQKVLARALQALREAQALLSEGLLPTNME